MIVLAFRPLLRSEFSANLTNRCTRQFTRCRLCAWSLRSHFSTQAPAHKLRVNEALCLKRSYICTCMKTKPEDFKIYEHEQMLHLSIGEDYSYSATGVLTYARQNPDINVLAKKSWILTDDYQAEFVYKNCVFVLFASFDNICVSPLSLIHI